VPSSEHVALHLKHVGLVDSGAQPSLAICAGQLLEQPGVQPYSWPSAATLWLHASQKASARLKSMAGRLLCSARVFPARPPAAGAPLAGWLRASPAQLCTPALA